MHGVGAFGLSWFAERLGLHEDALRAHSAKDRFWRIALKKSAAQLFGMLQGIRAREFVWYGSGRAPSCLMRGISRSV